MILTAKTDLTLMSGKSIIRKTERFIKDNHRLRDMDFLLSKVAESILQALPDMGELQNCKAQKNADSFKVVIDGGKHILHLKFGFQLEGIEANPLDIIFYRYESTEGEFLRGDLRIREFLEKSPSFNFEILPETVLGNNKEFFKLYRVLEAGGFSFPLLSEAQKEIVKIEDRNVLVQGAAGSGKTNVCIDKILFVAGRGYLGKIMYTTYSRGLLIDTKNKVEEYKNAIIRFAEEYGKGKVVFIDEEKRKAVENKLGIYISALEEKEIIKSLNKMVEYLSSKVDYLLIEDIYKAQSGKTPNISGEDYFIKRYIKNPKNRLSGRLDKLKTLSPEVIYKEVYGMIGGYCNPENPFAYLSNEDYFEARKESFTKSECDTIFAVAKGYHQNLAQSGLEDNNTLSKKILQNYPSHKKAYSLIIADEVQDMTRINLYLLREMATRVFCVGDALQMINPSFFSFAYLKNLLFRQEIGSTAAELSYNYRSTPQIADIVNTLGEINASVFGTHNFLLKGKSVENEVKTTACFTTDQNLLREMAKEEYENFTLIVNTTEKKNELRRHLKKQEILTVSEVKGLERDTVVLVDILSDNAEKWRTLSNTSLNRKTADENSVYRYYFNLFYVGISRAKINLFISERENIPLFAPLFNSKFEKLDGKATMEKIKTVADRGEMDLDELLDRISVFLNLGQYENARFTASKLNEDETRRRELARVDIYEKHVKVGNYRKAGLELWAKGLKEESKKMLVMSGDEELLDLLEESEKGNGLGGDIVRFFPDLEDNAHAQELIIEVLKEERENIKEEIQEVRKKFRK